MTNTTKNTTKSILAIQAKLAAIPPKPKIAATTAIIKKVIVHRNISVYI